MSLEGRLFEDVYRRPGQRRFYRIAEPGCRRPRLINVETVYRTRQIATACELMRCPDCGPKRKAETIRRLQLGLTAARAQRPDEPVYMLTVTLPPEVSVEAGMDSADVYKYAVKRVRKITDRAKARAHKSGRKRPAYFVVHEIQPGRGSIAPHILWLGEEGPFPASMMNPRMEVYRGQITTRARRQRQQTREYKQRVAWLEDLGLGWQHVFEPCLDAAAAAAYVAKYISKNIGNPRAMKLLPPRARGFSKSAGFMPTRDEWRMIYKLLDYRAHEDAWMEVQAEDIRISKFEQRAAMLRTDLLRRFASGIPYDNGRMPSWVWKYEGEWFRLLPDRPFWTEEPFKALLRGEYFPRAHVLEDRAEVLHAEYVTTLRECGEGGSLDYRDPEVTDTQ